MDKKKHQRSLHVGDIILVTKKGVGDESYVVINTTENQATVMSLKQEVDVYPDYKGCRFLIVGKQPLGPEPSPHIYNNPVWLEYQVTKIIEMRSGNIYVIKYKPIKLKENGTN